MEKNQKNRATKKPKKKNSDHMTDEIAAVLYIGISLMMGFSLYMKGGGVAGNIMNNFLLGALGISSYFVPILTFFYGVLLLLKKVSTKWNNYHTYSLIGILGISTFAQSIVYINPAYINTGSVWEVLQLAYFSKHALGGGFTGACLALFFIKLLGIYGAFIFYIMGLLIWLILIKKISISTLTQEAYNHIKKNYLRVKEAKKKQTQNKPKQFKKDPNEVSHPPISFAEEEKKEEHKIAIMDFSEKEKLQECSETSKSSTQVFENRAHRGQEQDKKEENVTDLIENQIEMQHIEYKYPSMDLLKSPPKNVSNKDYKKSLLSNAQKLEEVLRSFGVDAKVIQVSRGPAVTRYELQPGVGVKVSKIANLADDIALNLAAAGIRIEAPIPGKAAVGIEVPNVDVSPVFFKEVVESQQFEEFESKLAFGLGKDIAGHTVVADIGKMPHLLIAGATGSGKSVCINTLINSILYKAHPNEVKLLMIDPKVVELSIYNGIPHLLIPVVTDPKKAAGALNWAVTEMVRRYKLFSECNVRDMKGYNVLKKEQNEDEQLPQIIIIIDELADLMMVAPGEVEDAICRLAQMARAAGLHLVIATQRPSVDVITGVIKANIPSRIAFSVSSQIDSRTILDMAGAEKLLGKGDMLFYPMGAAKPQRIQGAFISDKEVESIVEAVKQKINTKYNESLINEIETTTTSNINEENQDELLYEAIQFIIEKEKASISMLQRAYRIGYNRAARIIDQMEQKGIISGEEGSKPRKVLITIQEYEAMINQTTVNEKLKDA